MMESVLRIDDEGANPVEGNVVFDLKKSFWNIGMILSALVFAPLTFSLESLALCLTLTYFTLLIGHSAGMHRMMIHRSFKAVKPVERLLIYIGVLVGMSGPYGIIRIHDIRDWAQRQSECHDFFSHKRNYFLDVWWQLTSSFNFRHEPKIVIEPKYQDEKFYQFLEETWRYHQVLLAIVLYYFGGWPFVVWGIFVRVSISILGHWSITYFCHNPGPGKWKVKDAVVQASNIPGLGLVTYGECWHNNHHAFPESAKIGLEKGQLDPAWYFIQGLRYLGLVYDVKLPRAKQLQDDLERS